MTGSSITACLSSKRHDWATPQVLFDRYDDEFDFDLDAAASRSNAKVARFIGPPGYSVGVEECAPSLTCVAVDALETPVWPGQRIWLNPPYGRGLVRWYAKVWEQVTLHGKKVVMLVPARTDTMYWHAYVWDGDHGRPHPWVERVDFLRGRLRFGDAKHGAPFPSAVVVFGA